MKPELDSKRDLAESHFREYAYEQPGRVTGTQPGHPVLEKRGDGHFSGRNKLEYLIMAVLICFCVMLAVFLVLT
jgi:hypothetical protein